MTINIEALKAQAEMHIKRGDSMSMDNAVILQILKDSQRLDFVVKNMAFIHWETRDSTFKMCELLTQDEDENFITLSKEGCSFATEREAIDSAIQKGE